MKLGKRLKQLDSMIPKGYDHIWDCCCDHGLLGMSLLKRNAAPNIHFVDIVPELIESLHLKLEDKFPQDTHQWSTTCCDASHLPLAEHEGKHLVIIAGVGGDETMNLIRKLNQSFPLLDIDYLLCPVYHQYALRQHLIELGFSLVDEKLVKERKQFYELLHVSPNRDIGAMISPCGSRIWQAHTEAELEVAEAYLQRTLAHYHKSQRRMGDEAEQRVRAYQAVMIRKTIPLNHQELDDAGLNLHAVFDLSSLPERLLKELKALYPELSSFKQLVLLAHGGKRMWQVVQNTFDDSNNPIDEHAINAATEFCRKNLPGGQFRIIYPSQSPVGLQSLGELAGWHHNSPFRIGINKQWGSWFAYRAAILSDSDFKTTSKVADESPCDVCTDKPCISACPANALESEFSLKKCLSYRRTPNSQCKDRCLARMACPVAKEHQYDLEQINYHYGISMKMIETLDL